MSGSAMIASITALNLKRVCESHHAIGVPTKMRMTVVIEANFIVTRRAERSYSFNIMVSHIHILR